MSGLSRLRPYIGVKEGFKGLRVSVWGLMFRFRGQMAGGGGFLSKFVSILGFWRFGPQTCAPILLRWEIQKMAARRRVVRRMAAMGIFLLTTRALLLLVVL